MKIKIYADGALGSRGAALKSSYSDLKSHKGTFLTSKDSIEKLAYRLATTPFQMNTHGIGDDANKFVLDAYNKASELYPENVELLFWGAVILCTDGKFDVAKPMFEKIFNINPSLKEMIPRLENHPMFPLSSDTVKKILAL